MSSSSRDTVDLQESLFEVQEEPGARSGPKKAKSRKAASTRVDAAEAFPEKEPPSAEFLRLVGKTKAKVDRRKGRPKTVAAAIFNRALAEVDVMLRTGDYDGAGARHFVALYDRMHERCYGVAPAELGPAERYNASMQASAMLRKEFNGDVVSMAEYMLWAWQREIGAETWRRENSREGRRIGVRLMFSGTLLTDYRVHLARTKRRA